VRCASGGAADRGLRGRQASPDGRVRLEGDEEARREKPPSGRGAGRVTPWAPAPSGPASSGPTGGRSRCSGLRPP